MDGPLNDDDEAKRKTLTIETRLGQISEPANEKWLVVFVKLGSLFVCRFVCIYMQPAISVSYEKMTIDKRR